MAGMRRFHLRKPDAKRISIKVLLDQIDPSFLPGVVLHQHHDLLSDYGLTCLHYPGTLLSHTDPSLIAAQHQSGITLSTSIHDLQEIHDLKALLSLSVFNYVFYSPVFNSISKPGYLGNITSDFRLTKNSAGPAVIALGGINHHHIQQLFAMNFDGAAVLGAVWNEPGDPLNNFIRIKDALNQSL